ncbi:MAG TPA: prephenate dehydrogenase/arogenate dehydrogenase family protein, partial [Polyangiaceae bacterium]
MKRLAIFGFGLIGASIAAAVRKAAPRIELVAIDLPATVSTPEVRALTDEQIDSTDRARLRTAVGLADLCVLAAPVSVIRAELPALLESAQVVTDCGSTKRSICAAVSGLPRARHFAPGHPMAGG